MAKHRWAIRARRWNGHGYDEIGKDADVKAEVMGTVKLLIYEIRPYQISITDLTQHNPQNIAVKLKTLDEV